MVVVRWTLISVIGQVENQNFYRLIFECGRFNLLLNNFNQQADAVYCGRQGGFNFSNWARRVSTFLVRVKYAIKVILNESCVQNAVILLSGLLKFLQIFH